MAASPLIVIVGETASGKSSLALQLAKKFNGEIICADSRTIYKGMDIGTAKPTNADRAQVPHHLLDIIKPDQPFNAAEFKKLANCSIKDIQKRDRLPIMVGGTGLYVDSVIFDYQFQGKSAERDPINPRHLKKTNEPSRKGKPRPNTLIIGLHLPREELKTRIEKRALQMLKDGLAKEVKRLSIEYGWDIPALNTIGYKEWKNYFASKQTKEEIKNLIIKNTVAFTGRQRTWFQRNKSIQWVNNSRNAVEIVTTFLNKLRY